MNTRCSLLISTLTKPVLVLTLLVATASGALAQKQKATPARKSFPAQPAQPAVPAGPVATESLSGLDLIPNRKTGQFGVRINHRISKPATFRLIETQTGRILRTDFLEPTPYATRALQVGRLATGEYKMEVVLTDTVYWKTVKVSR